MLCCNLLKRGAVRHPSDLARGDFLGAAFNPPSWRSLHIPWVLVLPLGLSQGLSLSGQHGEQALCSCPCRKTPCCSGRDGFSSCQREKREQAAVGWAGRCHGPQWGHSPGLHTRLMVVSSPGRGQERQHYIERRVPALFALRFGAWHLLSPQDDGCWGQSRAAAVAAAVRAELTAVSSLGPRHVPNQKPNVQPVFFL